MAGQILSGAGLRQKGVAQLGYDASKNAPVGAENDFFDFDRELEHLQTKE